MAATEAERAGCSTAARAVTATTIVVMLFAKGHGTGNDFVIVPDIDGLLDLPAGLVAALCDRRTGLGADGVLRVVRMSAAKRIEPALGASAGSGDTGSAEWFMDYRNADGGIAEMCGNGIRVFAKYLIERGLAVGPELVIATRAGERVVRALPDGQFTVDMGSARVTGTGAVEAGSQRLAGLAITVGNPHVACVVDQPIAAIDLTAPRLLAPADLKDGANVEVVRIVGDHDVEMRVHERGSGQTLSCGTGAVAAAVAAAVALGEWPDGPTVPWSVRVPGGMLAVTPSDTASLLTGPAEIIATGELAEGWIADRLPVGSSTSRDT